MEAETTPPADLESYLNKATLFSSGCAFIAFLIVPTGLFALFSMLLIPALFTIIWPTIALWLLTLLAFNALIKAIRPVRWSLAIALPATIAVMTAVPIMANREAWKPIQRAMAARDILPANKVSLGGDVLIRGPQQQEHARAVVRGWGCDTLCMTVLDAPGVSSVTVDLPEEDGGDRLSDRARTYRLLAKAKCPAETSEPVLNLPGSEARWRLRLSSSECLVQSPALARADQVLSLSDPAQAWPSADRQADAWWLGALPVRQERIELMDAQRGILLRKSIVRGEVYVVPLVIGLESSWKGPTYFQWARRSNLSQRSAFATIEPIETLERYASLRADTNSQPDAEMLRPRLEALVSQPEIALDDPALDLIDTWFFELGRSKRQASERDIRLIERMIAHRSIRKFGYVSSAASALDQDGLQRVRAAAARRFVSEPYPDRSMAGLMGIYAGDPTGSPPPLSRDEAAILADPERRKYAPQLIVRESGRGAISLPYLLDWLRFHSAADRKEVGDNPHRTAVNAVRRALCLLGPEAKSALPEIERMIALRQIPPPSWTEANWLFLTARLGKPVSRIGKPAKTNVSVQGFRSSLEFRLKQPLQIACA